MKLILKAISNTISSLLNKIFSECKAADRLATESTPAT